MSNNKKENLISIFQAISPLDYRYCLRNKKIINVLSPYLSEEGFIKYLARVESALVKVLSKRGVCSKSIAEEVANACSIVTAEEVYEEEDKIKHNIRALVNCIKKHISDSAKPFVHFTATSYDIIATADALRFKEFTNNALLGMLIELEKTLISIAEREKATLQIGRTHGQFAEPITYGFAIAQYVSRFGGRILEIERTANNLRGKFSGAVGAYNSLSLLFQDAEEFEEEIMNELGLSPSPISTQITEPEYITDFMHSIISAFGVIANLADDMRHLQRSEISEIAEFFDDKQVGSSTMPQKRNPINFENVKSMWKTFSPRMLTVYSDQISEHQRDLTNSASSRFIPEILAGFYISVERMNKVMQNVVIEQENMKRNFRMASDSIIAEPLYILLARYGHPDAHEYIRRLTIESQKTGKSLVELMENDSGLKKYLSKFTSKQKDTLYNPMKYVGVAERKVLEVCKLWRKRFRIGS